jgi:transcriptional regulator with XRE-family HTH domain
MATDISTIGSIIRGHRLRKGLSQRDVEKHTGLLPCYQSRIENGRTIPSVRSIQKIAAAYGVPLREVFGDTVQAEAQPGPSLSPDDIQFLTEIHRLSANLTDGRRALLLAEIKRFAQFAPSLQEAS